ncbi:MAG TPA: SDR family oxidoreductase [Solirubrobacterales bacterium]|nr:SDR family oxidoreductase [Solirubrobacterales bacterium]
MAPRGAPDLSGQVAVVTGGGRGIGCAYAAALAAAGAAVAIVARSADQLAEAAETIAAAGGRAIAIPADVTDPVAVEKVAAEVERELGPVDLLVNNAGVAGPIGPLWEADADAWWRNVEINLRGPFLTCRTFLPDMIARGKGRIVNVASGSGISAIPYFSAYVTSKTALIRMTEVLASELRGQGIALFAIEPGTVRTAMAEEILRSEEGRRWLPWLQRIFDEELDVTPEHSAEMVLLLASGRADRLSGRFLNRLDDLEALIAAADEMAGTDLLTLRLRRQSPT